MCGRYTLDQPEKIVKRFNVKNKLPLLDPNYNVAPSFTMPIVSKNSPNKVHMARWGFIPVWEVKKPKPFGLINIRSETTKEKPYFKKVLTTTRCLIPATGFFEWKELSLEGKAEKWPFYITIKNQSLIAFAGVYAEYDDAEGRPSISYAILTTQPNSFMARIHNRMPVILEPKDEEKYLETEDFDKLFQMLTKPYDSSKMQSHIVSRAVGSPRNNSKELIEEYKSDKPFGYGTSQTKIRF